MRRVSLLVVAVSIAACNKGTPSIANVICSQSRVPALAIQVQDAQTQSYIGSSTVAIATSGTYADTAVAAATAPDSTSLLLAYNKVGVFSVSVRRQSYTTWTRDSVTVEPVQGCDLPATVHLNVMLQPRF